MNFIKNIKNKKILFILTDHGSAYIINSLIKKYKLNKFNLFFLSEKTKYIFKKYKKSFLKKKLFSAYDVIIIGTGANPRKYYNLLKSFESNSRIYFLIDHWLGISARLNFDLINNHAVNLLFTDIKSIKNIKNKLKNSKSFKIPNFFFNETLKKLKKRKKYFYEYLYIDDLASYIKNKKVRKKVHNDCVQRFLYFLENYNKKNIKVLVRLHPNDKNNIIKNLIKVLYNNKQINLDKINFYFSNNKRNISHDLNLSERVVGSQSSSLLLSKKFGKFTYTSLRSKYIEKFAKNSPFFKKLS